MNIDDIKESNGLHLEKEGMFACGGIGTYHTINKKVAIEGKLEYYIHLIKKKVFVVENLQRKSESFVKYNLGKIQLLL